MRTNYIEQLDELSRQMTLMGDKVIKAISDVATALKTDDKELASSIIEHDKLINEEEQAIQNHCLKLLLMQQPVARDLRYISSALKMITDLERIGDYAVDIAEIVLLLQNKEVSLDYGYITEMAKACVKMVGDSVLAYTESDQEIACKVCDYDDVVDKLFIDMKQSLIQLIHTDVKAGEEALDLMMVAKYLERIGDHATNVAEWALFSITGQHVKRN